MILVGQTSLQGERLARRDTLGARRSELMPPVALGSRRGRVVLADTPVVHGVVEAPLKYVALLRGINVGKGARVPMKILKDLLEGLGLSDVVTYLNSGNVVFESGLSASELAQLIEEELERAFGETIPALVKTSTAMIEIAESIPSEWGNNDGEQTYVAYLFSDVAKPSLVSELPVKRQFMSIFYAHEAIVWNIKRENYNRSQITKIVGHSSYARMTTRNVNTARKLAALCAEL
jgi:uncharacterized protein (DUF1697 family)